MTKVLACVICSSKLDSPNVLEEKDNECYPKRFQCEKGKALDGAGTEHFEHFESCLAPKVRSEVDEY